MLEATDGGARVLDEVWILVVDDDEVVREMMCTVLRAGGFQVDSAEDAFVASEKLEGGKFDIAFLDVTLPGKSGLVLLREINAVRPELLVVVMTADATVATVLDAKKLGAIEFLTKPFHTLEGVLTLAHRLAARVREARPNTRPDPSATDDIGILIIDDDPSIRIVLTDLFQDEGFRVDEAEAPFVAIQKMGMARFDVLFTDVNMPGMTGIEFLRELRLANSECQAVVMSADHSVANAMAATRLGAADFLPKPFSSLNDVAALARRLARIVKERRAKTAASPAPPSGSVVLVFTDVEGSSVLWERQPDAMRQALACHDELMRRTISELGGYEVKTEGDAFMVAFGSARAATRWALSVQEQLLAVDWPSSLLTSKSATKERDRDDRLAWKGLRVRMGLHGGEPDCRLDPVTGRMDYFGPVVNRAARVSAAGHGGQILISDQVWRHVQPMLAELEADAIELGEHRLKNLEAPERIVQLLPRSVGRRAFPPLRTEEKKKGTTPAGGTRAASGATTDPREPTAPTSVSGQTWGSYLLSARVATLRIAEVLLARQLVPEGLGQKVVLMRFRSDLSTNPFFGQALMDDGRVAARLAHPNVVPILDLGKIGDHYYMTREDVPGWDLATVLAACHSLQVSIPPAFASRILSDVCAGLGAAHRIGLVHRDVSPNNILVSMDGSSRLIGFGLARAADSLPSIEPGMLRETVGYFAPEQARNDQLLDARVDLFSAGIVLWECLTGVPLFTRGNRGETLRAVLHDPVLRASTSSADIPPVAESILETALERSPARRYPTATAFQVDLEKLISLAPSRRLFAEWVRHLFRRAVESGAVGVRG